MRKRTFYGLAVLAAIAGTFLTASWAASTASPAQHYFDIQSAGALFSQGNYAAAAPLYAQLTSEDPDNGFLWLRQAVSYRNAGDAPKAIEAYEVLDRLGFGNAGTSRDTARLHAALGNKNAALDWLEKALGQRLVGRTTLATDPAFASLLTDRRFKRLAAIPDKTPQSRVAGWRADIDLLVEEAQRLHASLRREAFSKSWLRAAENLARDVPRLSDAELDLGIRRLVVMLNDGHSQALPGGFPATFRFVQVDLWMFPDGVYIINGDGEARNAVGSRVLTIGGKPIARLLQDVRAYSPHDNEMTYRLQFRVYLMVADILKGLGALPDPNEALFTVVGTDGVTRDVRVPVGTALRQSKLIPSLITSDPPPLYLQNPSLNFWNTYLPDLDAVYFQFNQVQNDPNQNKTIQRGADELWERLSETQANYLVVDVRRNNGGNVGLVSPLLRTLAAFEATNSDHRLFVITGRNTFSAAALFVGMIERLSRNPIFVGEPASAGPNFTAEESTRFTLPHSKIPVNISFIYNQTSGSDLDQRPWVPVSIPTTLTAPEYFGNQDPTMDALEEVIEGLGP